MVTQVTFEGTGSGEAPILEGGNFKLGDLATEVTQDRQLPRRTPLLSERDAEIARNRRTTLAEQKAYVNGLLTSDKTRILEAQLTKSHLVEFASDEAVLLPSREGKVVSMSGAVIYGLGVNLLAETLAEGERFPKTQADVSSMSERMNAAAGLISLAKGVGKPKVTGDGYNFDDVAMYETMKSATGQIEQQIEAFDRMLRS